MTSDSAAAGRRRTRLGGLALALVLSVQPVIVLAQSATAPVLTAAFLYSFTKFTEWPADALAPGQELSLCVIGDRAVRDALVQTVEGHALDGHPLSVQLVDAAGPLPSCHVLYVDAALAPRASALLARSRRAAIFTVSDADHFVEQGGVAQLVRDKDRMRFTVNVAAARRARLTLSSRLLSLATIVEE